MFDNKINDLSHETINRLFFEQIRQLSIEAARIPKMR